MTVKKIKNQKRQGWQTQSLIEQAVESHFKKLSLLAKKFYQKEHARICRRLIKTGM